MVERSKHKLVYGVVGTQNTGKSTFIGDVIGDSAKRDDEKLRFVSGIGEDYRERIRKEGLSINRNGDERCQNIIFDTLVHNVDEAVGFKWSNRIILDRTPIDAWAYTKWHDEYGDGGISKETLGSMWTRLLYSVRQFDRVLWIPLASCGDVPVEKSEQRDTNLEYRKQIDFIIADAIRELQKLGCRNIYSISGSRRNRVDSLFMFERFDENLKSEHCF